MKRTPLKRKTPLRNKTSLRQRSRPKPLEAIKGRGWTSLNRKSKLKQRSRKGRKQDEEYFRLREVFLKEQPACQCCCVRKSNQVHHAAGRGRFYLRVDTWLAVCHVCHEAITASRSWAESKGFSLTVAQRRAL